MKKTIVLRSPEMVEKYEKCLKEGADRNFLLNNPAIKEWQHWRLVENDFPYDMLARVHHMLAPKRIIQQEVQMTFEERVELGKIKIELNDEYDSIIENFIHTRSHRHHYHLHLIKYKYEQELGV